MSKMNAHITTNLRKRIRRRLDKSGGIEGLPMELMIIVVVATLGCTLLVGWMGNIDTPDTIGDVSASVDRIVMSGDTATTSFKVTVTDSDGDGISGATVVLSGCGICKTGSTSTVYGITDSHGTASFTGLSLTKTTPGVGYVSVHVSAGDYGENSSLKIAVVR